MRPLAARATAVEPFLAMEVMERAFELERRGIDIVHLEVGEPGFPPPVPAVEAVGRALAEGDTHYTDSRGQPGLRGAIAHELAARTGARVDPARVLVTGGTSPAMLLVFSLLVEPGDEVVLGEPHYPCIPSFVRFCGGTPVLVPTRPEEGYRLDPDAVARRVGPRTRALVVGSPANPTGAVQDRETLRALAGIGPPLVSDEIYQGLVYGEAPAPSAAGLPGEVFVLDGVSKRFAMTGFRIGWVVAPEWAVRPLQVLHQNLFISAGSVAQRAAEAALRHGEPARREMVEAYRRRRDRLVEGLRRLGFGIERPPEGAFYLLANARRFARDSRAFAFDLLERARVGVAPGIDFGPGAEGWVRFCYAVPDETIDEALVRLERALA